MPPETFKAFQIDKVNDKVSGAFRSLTLDDLSAGDVVVRVTHSSINYKDALAATGSAPILRRYPLVGGIDLAGEIVESDGADLEAGTPVLVTGCGLGETRDGGYAEYARVPVDAVIPIPAGMDARNAMQLGTAGFTAALAIHRMEQNGQEPSAGPIAVTGATGGVGSFAIDMLNARGYEVVAVTGKHDAAEYLRELGARDVLFRDALDTGSRPLEKSRWAGAIDNLGGEMLAWLLRTADDRANIASVGNAADLSLATTVLPFILRAVCLLGISSVSTPRDLRLTVWRRIGDDLKPRHLERIAANTIPFQRLPEKFSAYMKGEVTGRTVVEIA